MSEAGVGAVLWEPSMNEIDRQNLERNAATPMVTGAVGGNEPTALEAVKYLQEKVGSEVTAYLSGAEDVQTVERWSSGKELPGQVLASRLLYGYQTVRPIVERYDGETANAWLFGMNPWLGDEAPASVLRHSDRIEAWETVVHAAQDFAEFKP